MRLTAAKTSSSRRRAGPATAPTRADGATCTGTRARAHATRPAASVSAELELTEEDWQGQARRLAAQRLHNYRQRQQRATGQSGPSPQSQQVQANPAASRQRRKPARPLRGGVCGSVASPGVRHRRRRPAEQVPHVTPAPPTTAAAAAAAAAADFELASADPRLFCFDAQGRLIAREAPAVRVDERLRARQELGIDWMHDIDEVSINRRRNAASERSRSQQRQLASSAFVGENRANDETFQNQELPVQPPITALPVHERVLYGADADLEALLSVTGDTGNGDMPLVELAIQRALLTSYLHRRPDSLLPVDSSTPAADVTSIAATDNGDNGRFDDSAAATVLDTSGDSSVDDAAAAAIEAIRQGERNEAEEPMPLEEQYVEGDTSYENLLRLDYARNRRAEGLTLDQVLRLPTVQFQSPQKCNKTLSPTCSICLCDFEAGGRALKLPVCGHCFHGECLGGWVRTHDSCPNCRAKIVPERLGGR